MRILVINPGSTSTKLAVYEDTVCAWMTGAHHPAHDLAPFHHVNEQYEYRREFIINLLQKAGIEIRFDAVIARGGLLRPTPGGVYTINEQMKYDLLHSPHEHACNLGALIAEDIAALCQCPAFIADPEVVDELQPVARLTGIPEIRRISIFHALNTKAVARRYAKSLGKRYREMNFVIAHLGGGISVSAHRQGKVIDTNNALNGDGPFTPERAGTVPANQLVELCFSGKFDERQVKKMLCGQGGLVAHLGNNDMISIAANAEQGIMPDKLVLDSMLYNVAKHIGAMHVALEGKTDAIILTGGIMHSPYCSTELQRQVDYLAPVILMPGEDEMGALAANALGALREELPLQTYCPKGDN